MQALIVRRESELRNKQEIADVENSRLRESARQMDRQKADIDAHARRLTAR
jgi:hypothetical protein